MNMKNKILFIIGFVLFYIGDLTTTYYGLSHGAYESNVILNYVGFSATILLKSMFFIMLYMFVNNLEKRNYYTEIGIMNGVVMAFGLFTILNNVGLYA